MPPANVSGPASGLPCCTAPTSTPIAIAKAAGRIPLRVRVTHHAAASPGAAFGRARKNIHSLRAVSAAITTAYCLTYARECEGEATRGLRSRRDHEIVERCSQGVQE